MEHKPLTPTLPQSRSLHHDSADGAPVQISQSSEPHEGDNKLSRSSNLTPLNCTAASEACRTACLIGKENSYKVGVPVTVGANLDLEAIVSAAVSAEVSTTTSERTTDSNQQDYSGPWSCSMIITPKVQEVAGTQRLWVGCPLVGTEGCSVHGLVLDQVGRQIAHPARRALPVLQSRGF